MLIKTSGKKTTGTEQQSDYLAKLISRIAESEVFRTAPGIRKLLIYLWDHHGQSINEYTIATEALLRPSSFDPKTDASVRVQIARLRTKLSDFYAREGRGFPLQLSLPIGG